MKQNFNTIKFGMIVFVMMHIYSISIIGSAGVTVGRMATKFVPTVVSSTMNQTNSNTTTSAPTTTSTPKYTAPKFYIPTNPLNTLATNIPANFDEMNRNTKKTTDQKYSIPSFVARPVNKPQPDSLEDIVKKVLSGTVQLPDNNEFHINHDFLTDEDIESFKNKFKDETDIFMTKLSEFWTLIKDKYDEIRNDSDVKATPITQNKNEPVAAPIIVNHDEVIVHIKNVTEKIFDPNDQRPLSAYIIDMKNLTEALNPTDGEDKIIIDAIDFLQKNQHRTSMWDIPFWTQAAQEQGLNKIPKSDALESIPKTTMISTLTSKANLKP